MDNPVSDYRTPLAIGFLRQSGFKLHDQSGSTVNSLALLKALHSRGHDVSLLALQSGRQVVELGNTQLRPKEKELGFSNCKPFKLVEGSVRFVQSRLNLPYLGLFDSFRFREACLKHLSHCDIFHERYTLMSLGGVWAARKLSIPLILEVHADIINVEMPLHNRPLRGAQRYSAELVTHQCFKQASKIVVVSKAVGKRLQTYWRVPADKIMTVPNAVDLELFNPMVENPGTRTEVGLGDEPVVMFIGSFLPWHGLDNLIEAFSKVVLEIPRAKLVLVGDGWIRADLEVQAKEVGLADKVIFTGSVPHQKVPALLSIADVAVAPYPDLSAELWFSPLKLFEYMAAAKAIVASSVGQVAEVLEDGYSGLSVEPGNVEALSQALIKLLKDKELRWSLGKNARREAVEKHSWQSRASKLEEIYRSVLGMS
jgi:glycosyltransferase involved in cell wall biosynthesis